MPYMAVLPKEYETKSNRYAVLYLLHGWNGDETNWVRLTHLIEDAAPYPLIVITPRGDNSWYVNSATKSEDRYEDYIQKDLIDEVDTHFRTIASRNGRAIAGLSMGGYGAMLFTFKHPEKFGFAASISGAFAGPSGIEYVLPQLQPSTDAAFGNAANSTRRENNLDLLLPAAKKESIPYLFLQCGSSDPLLASNRHLVSELSSHQLAYEYHELPGAHTWDFWNNALPAMLQSLADHLPLPSQAHVGSTVITKETHVH